MAGWEGDMNKTPEWMLVSMYLENGYALEWTHEHWLALTDDGWVPVPAEPSQAHAEMIAA
jgi:hypothetical protein